MIRIPAGSFMMGSPDTERSRETDEGPVHQVTIANDFFMGQTEVTQAQWEVVMGSLPDLEFGDGDNRPVYSVSWLECQDFLVALNALSGEGTFRLPTEAEWEYACRAGTTKRFYFGNSLGCDDGGLCEDCEAEEEVIGGGKSLPWESTASPLDFEPKLPLPFNLMRSDFMWFCANSDTPPQRVRSLRSNAFGLFDMSGNVFEWVQDAYHSDYTGAPTDGSAWVADGNGNRVIRGGFFASTAGFCRSAQLLQGDPSVTSPDRGFRIVWTP
jgi:formylglycine-generating enzyme required for sulfatase activity